MWSNPPFALFVLIDVSSRQINKVLEAAFRGTRFSENCFWLPSDIDHYSDAPKKISGKATEGTKPPVSSYTSPFIRKEGAYVATWLRNKPKEANVDEHFFAIIDKSVGKDLLVIGRQGGLNLEDMNHLEFLRLDVEYAAASLFAAEYGTWEEVKTSKGVAEIQY